MPPKIVDDPTLELSRLDGAAKWSAPITGFGIRYQSFVLEFRTVIIDVKWVRWEYPGDIYDQTDFYL